MAGTTKDKLDLLMATKEAIRKAIEDMGVNLVDGSKFSSYPAAIRGINTLGFNTAQKVKIFAAQIAKKVTASFAAIANMASNANGKTVIYE